MRKARALGALGAQWLNELDDVLTDLELDWSIEIGAVLAGGTGGLVAEVLCSDGTPAILKVPIPDGLDGQGPFEGEMRALLLGQGLGYVDVLRYEPSRRAVLLERLGPALSSLHWTVEKQIDVIARTVRECWSQPTPNSGLRTGADQAEYLANSVATDWEQLGRPCPPRVIAQAQDFARSRRDAYDPTTAVQIHGDAHPANILAAGTGGQLTAFKLIDPDGMMSEPAHDLAISLRDWTDELLAGDAVELGTAWCHQLADSAAAPAQAIWEWAFLERVSTGLFMMRLGDPHGERLLAIADRWTNARSATPLGRIAP